MADLILGPMLRFVSETEATVWVETDEACEVSVLGATEPTFRVDGHHYALVRVEGLEPGSENPYEVALDGSVRWPESGSDLPRSLIRTLGGEDGFDIAFGSCRVAYPHEEPYTKSKDEDEDGHEVDALWVLAQEMIREDRERFPELLFLLGDQVYVDEGSPEAREKIRDRRGTDTAPGEEVTDFEEYTWLYQESWRVPLIRWLFANVPTSMLWDDHDMSDDWNISHSWVSEMSQRAWWHRRMVGCIASYWIYQHIGNLSPAELDDNEIYREVRGNQRADEVLFDWARRIDKTEAGTRWSFCRDFGKTRAIFVDSRAGRVLEPNRRAMVDDEEWDWIVEHSEGDFDHLLIATTVPWLLAPGLDRLEAWDEKVGEGAWGDRAAKVAEKLRRGVDFDHWGAFSESFAKLRDLLREVAEGERGERPASVVVLSGDVHHAYLCDVGFPVGGGAHGGGGAGANGDGTRAPIYQAVCSPYRNPLSKKERAVIRTAFSRPFSALTAGLAKLAGADDPGVRWRLLDGPCFDNQVATLRIDGRSASMRLDKTVPGDREQQALECSFERRLS